MTIKGEKIVMSSAKKTEDYDLQHAHKQDI